MTTENDDQIARLFSAAAADLYPPVEEMLEYGMARGAVVRRRRTAFSLVGGTGALAAVVAVTLTLVHSGAPAPAPGGAPAGVPLSAGASAPPAGAASTSASYFQILSSLLPAGTVVAAAGGPTPGVAVDYNDGNGAGDVEVMTQLYSDDHVSGDSQVSTTSDSCAGWVQGTDHGPRPVGAPTAGCHDTLLPGGITQITMVTGADQNGVYYNEVEYFRQDGVEVTVTAGNGVVEIDGASRLTRIQPVLSTAQLLTIAADPRW